MIDFSGLSDIGPVREENQDAFFLPDAACPPGSGPLFALADGMGGYAQGGVASTLALQAIYDTYYNHANGKIPGTLKRGVEAANLAVLSAAREMGVSHMGTTLIAAAIEGSRLHMAHVGDSRAYLIRDGAADLLTQDHTVVSDLLKLRVITSDQVRTHARRSVLTRAVGLGMFVQPDVFSVDLLPGDRLVLCSDGLWSVVQDDEFAQHGHSASSTEDLCRRLLDLALARGTDDNVSVLAVHVKEIAGSSTVATTGANGKVRKSWIARVLRR